MSRNHITSYIEGEPHWTKGRFGGALTFTENGDFLRSVVDPQLSLGRDDFSISLWFRGPESGDDDGHWRCLFDYNGYGNAGSPPGLAITTQFEALRISFGSWFLDPEFTRMGPKTVFNDTDWYNVVLVRKNGVATAYVNGVAELSAQRPVDLQIEQLHFGAGPNTTKGCSFHGAIDDIAIWKQALTPSQIRALAEGRATPLTVLRFDSSRSDKHNESDVRQRQEQDTERR